MIPVTKPFLPPRAKYEKYLEGIYARQWLTNNGPLVNEFELKLKKYLNQKHLLYLSNGTIALQIAIKALGLKGEIITTPFSYVATTSSIVWEGCEPVFADIDPNTLNIDPNRIANLVTPRTSAILATHCFGNACNIDAIQTLANRHGLKVIYDGAHCFGTLYNGRSVFDFGDVCTLSLHATKLMHSVEGGAVFTQDPDLLKRMAYMRNFGHDGPERFSCMGINGKNSEFHAAMGLCVLECVDEIISKRKLLIDHYDAVLQDLDVMRPELQSGCEYNYAYYPILFRSEAHLIKSVQALNRMEIFPRRYFYPSLSRLTYVNNQETPVSDDVAGRILCLPLYHDLSHEEQDLIIRQLLRTQKYG